MSKIKHIRTHGDFLAYSVPDVLKRTNKLGGKLARRKALASFFRSALLFTAHTAIALVMLVVLYFISVVFLLAFN